METSDVSLPIAFAAGVLSFLSPCVLPLVPAYIGHLAGTSAAISGGKRAQARTFAHALAFVLGFSVVFVLLGASAGFFGGLIYDKLPALRQVGGIFLVALGLHVMGILKVPFLYRERRIVLNVGPRLGYLASFAVGVSFSAGWTPCVGTILGTILFIASMTETGWRGAYLLAVYSLGLGIPFLVAGLAIGSAADFLKRLNRYLNAVSLVSGVLLILMGIAVYADLLRRFTYLWYWLPGGI